VPFVAGNSQVMVLHGSCCISLDKCYWYLVVTYMLISHLAIRRFYGLSMSRSIIIHFTILAYASSLLAFSLCTSFSYSMMA
jgi:hypothetical protein